MACLTLTLPACDDTAARRACPCPWPLAMARLLGLPDPIPAPWRLHGYTACLSLTLSSIKAQLHGQPAPGPARQRWHGCTACLPLPLPPGNGYGNCQWPLPMAMAWLLPMSLGDGIATQPACPCPLAMARLHGLPAPTPRLHGLPAPAPTPWRWHSYMTCRPQPLPRARR
jgi:hypothetical protein